ncbi:hypothetical protein D3C72_1849880 [compost metagenome]
MLVCDGLTGHYDGGRSNYLEQCESRHDGSHEPYPARLAGGHHLINREIFVLNTDFLKQKALQMQGFGQYKAFRL